MRKSALLLLLCWVFVCGFVGGFMVVRLTEFLKPTSQVIRDQNAMYHQLFLEQIAVAYPDKGAAWVLMAAQRVGVDTNHLVVPGVLK